MANIIEPKYDTDNVNYGFLKKMLSLNKEQQEEILNQFSKSFSSPPNPPYYVGWTYTSNNKVYRCIKDRLVGSFSISDWMIIYDEGKEEKITKNFLFLSEVEIKEQQDGKIETFYQQTDPSANWDTAIFKEIHVGDYWRTNIDGIYKNYIYVKYATNPITYAWELIDVPITIFDTISGHKTIYTTKPTSYTKADLWKITEDDLTLFQNLDLVTGDYLEALNTSNVFSTTDWQKKEDELTLKSIETYYYTTKEIDKIVEVINTNVDAKILNNGNSIKAYVSESFTTKETTNSLTQAVNANGDAIEAIYGKNTTQIPTLNLAQLSILADGINSTVSNKVGKNEIISSINQSAELVKILASQIQFEGLVTANNYFKILQDGSIEAINGSFKGNIYLNNGSQIIGGNGLMTNLNYVGVPNSGSGDFGFLGFKTSIDMSDNPNPDKKTRIAFDVYIPENFTVVDARVILFHAPVNFGYYDLNDNQVYAWGYSRNIKLYKQNTLNFYRRAYIMSSYDDIDVTTDTEIPGVLGTNGFTAEVPSESSHSTQQLISGNFKSNLQAGLNRFILRTSNNEPSGSYGYYGNLIECAKQTGCVRAYISIIGYLKY